MASKSHLRPIKPLRSRVEMRESEAMGLRWPLSVSISPAKRRLSSLDEYVSSLRYEPDASDGSLPKIATTKTQ